MENWDELRTAYEVARHGTVSGAAAALGVHHATVIRHIDALEARLGVKLFQRHARGYTPTEAGQELARVAKATDDQFAQLAARISGQGGEVSGELVVTTLAGFARRIVPLLARFQEEHPGVRIRLSTGTRLFRLEYGEAHVAIRAGRAPDEPDNVVQLLDTLDMGLYAAPAYIERMGDPREGLEGHVFVAPEAEDRGPPAFDWLRKHVPVEQQVFRSSDEIAVSEAIRVGLGLGFMVQGDTEGLIEVLAPRPEWQVTTWLVTHVDLHRTAKVQALTHFLKNACKNGEIL